MAYRKPSDEELALAIHKTMPDILAPSLRVVFCGINPGLYTAAVGHHYARPGNRFWPALHRSGFTDRQLKPHEDRLMLTMGYGMTNVVSRPTLAAAELTREEYETGGKKLREKILHYQPKWLAVLGLGAYRLAFEDKRAQVGLQPTRIGNTSIWLLPSPSGLNAHYTPSLLTDEFRLFRQLVDQTT